MHTPFYMDVYGKVGDLMAKIVQLELYRKAVQAKLQQNIVITGAEVLGEKSIEVVVDIRGEVEVLRLTKQENGKWLCVAKTLEQVIEEILNEDPGDNANC